MLKLFQLQSEFGHLSLVGVIDRMLKAWSMGQLLLYGFPEYMDFRERKGEDEFPIYLCTILQENLICRDFGLK